MHTHVRFSIFGLLALAVSALTACQTADTGISASNINLSSYAHNIDIAAKKPWSIQDVTVPEPVRAGKKATRFELRHGDCGSDGMWDDCTMDRGRVEKIVTEDFDRIGQESWYGFSVYVPEQLRDIDPSSSDIFQWKPVNWREPLVFLGMWRGHLTFNMPATAHERCGIMPLYEMRNKWTDFVFHVKWSRDDDGVVEFWINGSDKRHKCSFDGINAPANASGPIHPHWGIYQYYVSRWLARNSHNGIVKTLAANPWVDERPGTTSKVSSYTATPFQYDWGVELPTAIIYHDEIRMGSSRAAVDIRMIEARGGEAVD